MRAHLTKREHDLRLRYHPGARLVFADGTPDILAYPRDRAGWGRLTRLLTLGNLRGKKAECILTREDLVAHLFGLELVVASFVPACGEKVASAEGARRMRWRLDKLRLVIIPLTRPPSFHSGRRPPPARGER